MYGYLLPFSTLNLIQFQLKIPYRKLILFKNIVPDSTTKHIKLKICQLIWITERFYFAVGYTQCIQSQSFKFVLARINVNSRNKFDF